MSKEWPRVSLGELLRLERRPVKVEPENLYQEIGIYCFGRGIFHKNPRTGFEVGNKDLFLMKEGDFILQVTFAWEGAIAIVSAADDGMYGSTRYPTFRVDETRCAPRFLLNYFRTHEGRQQLVTICPGSAGRNRVLSIKRIPEVLIPLPPIPEQRRIVARIEELAAQIHEALTLRHQAAEEAEALIPRTTTLLLDEAGWPTSPLRQVLAEKPRNGLGPQQEVDSGGRRMLRINAVSSSPTRYVDMTAAKQVQMSDDVAEQFVIQNDDVFIVRYNGDIRRVAKPAIYKGANEARVVYPDKLMRLRPDPRTMTPDFLVSALNSRTVRTQIEDLGKTTAGNIGISGADAQLFVVPVPPLTEQRRIVAELDTLQAEVNALKRLQTETAAELDALLPSVLDKAFRGEL
jgi:type I restriction enzyme, S subunit